MGLILSKGVNCDYLEVGQGRPIIVLHGLMGGLSNFHGVTDYFGSNGYRVIIPELPLYTTNLLKNQHQVFCKFLEGFYGRT